MGYLTNSGTGFLKGAVTTVSNVKSYLVNKTGYLVDAIRVGIGDFGQRVLDDGGTVEASAEAAASYREITKDIYDQASLVLFPSGYKDNLLYSHKPVDGSADFTYTRGTDTATRVGADGYIKKERANLLEQSNQFDTTWNLSGGSTLNQNAVGIDNIPNTAWTFTKDDTFDGIKQNISLSGINTFSVYAKKIDSSVNELVLRINVAGGNRVAIFDLSDGTKVSMTSDSSAVHYDIQKAGNGWYRCSFVVSGTIANVDIRMDYNQTGTGSILVQNAQLEQGLVATPYIETTTAPVYEGLTDNLPRIDYTGGTPSILLEPSRANKVTQSEYLGSWFSSGGTLTPNAAISPEGVQNAYSYTNSEFTTLRDSVTLSTSTQYTFSFYAKNVDATIARYRVYDDTNAADIISATSYFSQLSTNEWKRIEVTFTTSATGTQYGVYLQNANQSGKMLFYGAQLEEGSYATSYIPNHSGGSVTREADSSIVESLGYSSTCTFYYEFNTTTGREGSSPFAEVGKDNSNKFYIKGSSESNPQFQVQGNGIFSGSISPTNEVSGTNKIVVQWSSGVGVVFSNGVKQIGTLTNSNTSENIDFITMKGNGTFHDSKQLLFFEQALPDNQCIALTS